MPPLDEIGLTDLPKPGWAIAHSAQPSPNKFLLYFFQNRAGGSIIPPFPPLFRTALNCSPDCSIPLLEKLWELFPNPHHVLTDSLCSGPYNYLSTVKLGNKEQFDKEQIGIKETFPVTCHLLHKDKEQF